MPAYGCQACGAQYYSAGRLEDLADGGRCNGCGGELVELARKRTLEDREVGNALYGARSGDVAAAPIDPPIEGGW